jgi:hypothetical protein
MVASSHTYAGEHTFIDDPAGMLPSNRYFVTGRIHN